VINIYLRFILYDTNNDRLYDKKITVKNKKEIAKVIEELKHYGVSLFEYDKAYFNS
jgi:hypothetical protein